MTVLDDILGFFRDITFGSRRESDDRRDLRDEDVPAVTRFIRNEIDILIRLGPGPFGPGTGEILARLRDKLGPDIFSVEDLRAAITEEIAEELRPILGLTNIDRDESVAGDQLGTAFGEFRIFERGNQAARNGAAAATGLVTALNVLALLADGGTQALTLGQIRGWQQFVQNIIWATGLADLGGLGFRPQIATSFAPLLNRYWNTQSQAEIPGQQDLILFQVREVFDRARRAELEADQTPQTFRDFMSQRGFAQFWADSYWAAHWAPLADTQLNEFVHRGIIDEDEWFRQQVFNDVLPRNIEWKRELIKEPYTRVDARRMADLGVLTDEELLQAYADLGYFAPRADDGTGRLVAQFVPELEFDATVHRAQGLVVFTRVFNALPSIRRRLSNGFLRAEEVNAEIRALGVPDATATKLTQELVDAEDLNQAEATRKLTASQIVRGVDGQLISFQQGQALLERLGYDPARAEFLLRLRVIPEDAPPIDTELGQRLLGGQA